MAALPNSDDPNAPDRSRHTPSDLHKKRPVHAAPPAHGDFDADAGYETEDAHTHEDEADSLQRRLRRRRRANLPGLLLTGVAALALAGGLAFWMSGGNDTAPGPASVVPGAAPTPVPPVREQRSAVAPSAPARVEPPTELPRAAPPEPARDAAPAPSVVPPQAAPEQPAAGPPEPNAVARAEPTEPAVAPSPGQTAAPSPSPGIAIPPAEVAGLLKRARELIELGDIGAARLLLERAAGANDGTALFALAETYDPAMLTRWRVQGVRPNVDRARSLYQRALDQGAGEARERLAGLR